MKNNIDTKTKLIKDIVEMLEQTNVLFLRYMQAFIKELIKDAEGGE